MHRIFRKALDTATGDAHSIIAVIIDIRNFSPFSLERDSFEIAMFLKRVYINIIDSYFNFASFYKSTGDGLLLTIPFDANNLEEVAQKTIANCMDCHREFGNICSGDHLINFEIPGKIGIGVARGAACRLISGRKIIDYSGRLLNLTSRLTALARPSGIVIDQSLGIGLLDEDTRKNFKEQYVYLGGIAEDEPIQVYFTKEFTMIPKRNTEPIAAERWQHIEDNKLFRDLLKLDRFGYPLESKAASAEDIKVRVSHDKVIKGRVSKEYSSTFYFGDFTYKVMTGKPMVRVDFPKLCKRLKQNHVKENMNVKIEIAYVEK